jgi:hypothetical protein
MEEKTILFANVKIPIEVKPDGTIDPLKEHITIEFTRCTELPPKQETEVNYSFVMNNIKELLHGDSVITKPTEKVESECQTYAHEFPVEQIQIMVLKEEIKREKKDKKNSSFRNNPKNFIRHTMRSYE